MGQVDTSKLLGSDNDEPDSSSLTSKEMQQLRDQVAGLQAEHRDVVDTLDAAKKEHDEKVKALSKETAEAEAKCNLANERAQSITQQLEAQHASAMAEADAKFRTLAQEADRDAGEMADIFAQEREERLALDRAVAARQKMDAAGLHAAEAEFEDNAAFLAKCELQVAKMQADNSSLVQNASATVFHLTERLRETEETLQLTKEDALTVAAAHRRLAEIQRLQNQHASPSAVGQSTAVSACQTEPVKLAAEVTSRAVEALQAQCAKELAWERERAEAAEQRVAELEEHVQTLETAAFAADLQQKAKDKEAAYALAEAHEKLAALSKDMQVVSQVSAHLQRTETETREQKTVGVLEQASEQLRQMETDLSKTRAGYKHVESKVAAASKQAKELHTEMQQDENLTEGAVMWAERILTIFTAMEQQADTPHDHESDAVIAAEKQLGNQAEQELQAMRMKFQTLMSASEPRLKPEPEPEPEPEVEVVSKVEHEQTIAELQQKSEQQISAMTSELRDSHTAELEAREQLHALKESEAAAAHQDEIKRLCDEAQERYDSAVQRAQGAEELVVPYQHQLRRLTVEVEAARMNVSEAERARQVQAAEADEIRARLIEMVEAVEAERAELKANPANPVELKRERSRAEAAREALLEIQGRYQALESDALKTSARCELAVGELDRCRPELQRLRQDELVWERAEAVTQRTIAECQGQMQWLRTELQRTHTAARQMKTAVEQAQADAARWRAELADVKCRAAIAIGKNQAAGKPTAEIVTSPAAAEPPLSFVTTVSELDSPRPAAAAGTADGDSVMSLPPKRQVSASETLEQMRNRLRQMEERARATLSTSSAVSAHYDVGSSTWQYRESATEAVTPHSSRRRSPPPPSPVVEPRIIASPLAAGSATAVRGASEMRAQATLRELTGKLSRVQSDLDGVRGLMPSPTP
jgi:hypothetical protein